MSRASQYSEATLASIQELFGQGFLSPGGAAEVRAMVEGLDLGGHSVLDLGCGLGGGALVLAGELGAGGVLGIDVEPDSLARAESAAKSAGLDDRIAFELVEPGPLPLEATAFDLVFSKEAICHVADKAGLFAEVFRVLRPGGSFAGSDWMAGREGNLSEAYETWAGHLEKAGLDFTFATPQAHADALAAVGFVDIEARDRSADALTESRRNVKQVLEDGRERLRAELGESGYADFLERARARLAALEDGDLLRCHLRARKPG